MQGSADPATGPERTAGAKSKRAASEEGSAAGASTEPDLDSRVMELCGEPRTQDFVLKALKCTAPGAFLPAPLARGQPATGSAWVGWNAIAAVRPCRACASVPHRCHSATRASTGAVVGKGVSWNRPGCRSALLALTLPACTAHTIRTVHARHTRGSLTDGEWTANNP